MAYTFMTCIGGTVIFHFIRCVTDAINSDYIYIRVVKFEIQYTLLYGSDPTVQQI